MNDVTSSDPTRDRLVQEVGSALRGMIREMEAARESVAKAARIHSTDLACLYYLYGLGKPVSIKQIVAEMKMNSSAVTALLDRLEAAGFTRRLPNPEDRRGILIELDVSRAESALQSYRQVEQGYRSVTDALGERDLSTVITFIQGITEITQKMRRAENAE